ncbi:hypothetical protein [Rariglobus hedericola]|uniref:PA14 domain-containing protein n=1 Tax=Rariglobus hedericola TaxID=2597822 RepID=A0A556QS52_9BACT|nr:hypothetical protein [Rariglobus hedericola]TSJ79468.1 hypothetical protein FPL22_09325 [Rariglobus hedericola]
MSTVTVSTIRTRLPRQGHTTLAAFALCLAAVPFFTPAAFAQSEAAFGSSERKGATLIGIFYDLKQTQQREPIPEFARRYTPSLDEFLVSGFDEALLNRYFRAALPLYTTQLAVPMMSASGAPKAFGVENVVKPSYWVIHYKGQIAPPTDGTYRFVGNFDDLLVVAINRKVVLDGSRPDTKFARLGWKEPADKGPRVAANELSKYGDWVVLKAGQPVDIDILIGERPGGQFHGLLLYEKKGETYPPAPNGRAALPLFQLAEKPTPNNQILTDRPPWKCFN